MSVMTQQLPTAITSPTVKNVLLGPGALINLGTLFAEMDRFADLLVGKRVYVHPAAAIVTEAHAYAESAGRMSKIGSTTKGVGAAAVQRIMRDPDNQNVAGHGPYKTMLEDRGIIIDADLYRLALHAAEAVIVEGAQGFSLSMYHGFYPYTTSRDVTPWQIAADCGLPFKWASYIQIWGTLRTFPIRVNNRDGTSGPGYPDQQELSWQDVGISPELTTVTKLPRRIFTFSQEQLEQAMWHCGHYWQTNLFLNFANYVGNPDALSDLIRQIETPTPKMLMPGRVALLGFGADDADVVERGQPWKVESVEVDSEGGVI